MTFLAAAASPRETSSKYDFTRVFMNFLSQGEAESSKPVEDTIEISWQRIYILYWNYQGMWTLTKFVDVFNFFFIMPVDFFILISAIFASTYEFRMRNLHSEERNFIIF